jgi:hypothetical protein
LRAGVQAVDVIVGALAGIRKAVRARAKIDRRRHSQRASQGLNDVGAALDLHYGTDWSDLLGDAEFLDRTDELAVQQLADKIRAAGHVTAEDAQSCVEDFRVDDDMILKVRDSVSVARRKLLQRGCALITRRMPVPAVWLHARSVQAAYVRARYMCTRRTFALLFPPGMWCVQQARPRQNVLRVRPRRHVSGVDARVAAGARTA